MMAIIERLREDKNLNTAKLYDDDNDERLHINAIEMLALRDEASIEDVKRLYEIVLRRFKKSAKIKDFLPILVSRRVEYLLNIRKNKKENNTKLYQYSQK
jgi:hypothetical protein